MPSPIPVVLDHLRFASQNQARQHFSDMLHRYQPGQSLNPADSTELQSLLKRHPLYDKTPLASLDRLHVATAGFGRHCFSAQQPDRSKRNVSFVQCIRNCRDHPDPEASNPEPKKTAPETIALPAQPQPQEQKPVQAKPPVPVTDIPASTATPVLPAPKPTPTPTLKKPTPPTKATKPKKERTQ
ncbi:MAG: DUF3223 domain-containing protein [Proteobacteria bacterium]|nr:DUF3223 domain-containing protein [Pseudomonadota bacterium]